MASWRGIKFNFPRLASHCFSYTEHDIQNTVIHATESSLSSSLSLCNLKFHLAETRYVTGFELEAFFQAGRANFDAYYRLRDAIVRNSPRVGKKSCLRIVRVQSFFQPACFDLHRCPNYLHALSPESKIADNETNGFYSFAVDRRRG